MFYHPLSDACSPESSEWAIPLTESPRTGPNRSFIPGTNIQYIYDSTSLNLLKECPRKYSLKMLQGWDWQIKPATLQFGIDFHLCLETYHKLRAHGFDFDTAQRRTLRLAALRGERLISNRTERTKETLMRCVVWYLDQFRNDPAVTALLADGTPAVELSFLIPLCKIRLPPTDELPPLHLSDVMKELGEDEIPYTELHKAVSQGRKLFGKLEISKYIHSEIRQKLKESFYSITIYLSGHIDRVVHYQGEVFVTDYKTSKAALDDRFLEKFNPSLQFMLYLTAAHVLAHSPNSVFPSPPAGVIIDGIQLGTNFNRFQRFFYRKTREDIDKFLTDLEATIKVKALGYTQCDTWPAEEPSCHNYGGCEFLPVCTRAPSEWPRLLRANYQQNTWDPSQPR